MPTITQEVENKCMEIIESNKDWHSEAVKYLKSRGFSDKEVNVIIEKWSEGKSWYPYLDK